MNLGKKEFMLVVDATNGLAFYDKETMSARSQILLDVKDAISLGHLDEKWDVDAKSLIDKMENANEEEYKQLWKNIGEFWARNDRENNG